MKQKAFKLPPGTNPPRITQMAPPPFGDGKVRYSDDWGRTWHLL